jgi:hypothetical protein
VQIYAWVNFEDPRQAAKAGTALEREGYDVEFQEQADDAVAILAIPREALPEDALRTRMRSLADEFGGEFLGDGGSEQHVLK